MVVCDGFVGNVALKTSEGLAQMLGGFVKEEFTRTWWTKLAALVAMPVIKRFQAGASTIGATTAPACWACAASWSRATARPTSSRSARARARRSRRRAIGVLERTIAAMQPFVAQLGAVPGAEPTPEAA